MDNFIGIVIGAVKFEDDIVVDDKTVEVAFLVVSSVIVADVVFTIVILEVFTVVASFDIVIDVFVVTWR